MITRQDVEKEIAKELSQKTIDYEYVIRSKMSLLFEDSPQMIKIFRAIRNGSATYDEAHSFALEMSRITTEAFASTYSYIEDVPLDEFMEYIIGNVGQMNTSLVGTICKEVQYDLNEASGIGLKPVETKASAKGVQQTMERIRQAAEKGEDALRLALHDPFRDESLKLVDKYIRSNASFQKRVGLAPQMVRVWDGTWGSHDTKHTDYCHKLQGSWEYGDEPKDFYMRHEGCTCKCLYYPDKNTQGRMMALAKGEKDTQGTLAHTGVYTSTNRRAVLEQRRKRFGRDEARKMLNEEWKGGMNGNAERHFS